MTETIETSILEEGNVKITNLRAIIGTKTYAMSNVTSVNMGKNKPSDTPRTIAGIGMLVAIGAFVSIEDFSGVYLSARC